MYSIQLITLICLLIIFFFNQGDDKLTDVKGSYYARVFGNELAYGQVNGVEGKLPNFLDMLISLANRQDVTYTYSSQLMDVALIVPTVAGEITVDCCLFFPTSSSPSGIFICRILCFIYLNCI